MGLDDVEYVGGVIYLGLTWRGAEGTDEQRRVIVDGLCRWATRPGSQSWQHKYSTTTKLAAAIADVLKTHL